MDALPLNIRVPAELPSVSVKRNLTESPPPVDHADPITGFSPASVTATEKVDDPLQPQSANNSHQRVNSKEIENIVKGANRFFEQISRELRFQQSESGNEMVVQVVDQNTREVIRQFPSEEMLQISKDLEKISGLLFKDSA